MSVDEIVADDCAYNGADDFELRRKRERDAHGDAVPSSTSNDAEVSVW